MSTHADKTQEYKKKSIVNKKESSTPTFQLKNNRSEANTQKKQQENVDNSVQTQQTAQMQSIANDYTTDQQTTIQKKENNTGLPDNLKTGMENLSGMSLDHVKVHYNSPKPATVQAHAYAQGSEIHLASGQEKHLPHELGHVVQQMEGRVKPTTSVNGVAVNDSASLENEATVMGNKALSSENTNTIQTRSLSTNNTKNKPVQQQAKVIQRQIMSNATWEANCINKVPSAMITADLIFATTALDDFHKNPSITDLEKIIKYTTSWIEWHRAELPSGLDEALDTVGFLKTTAEMEKKAMEKAATKATTINAIIGELTETSGKAGADELFAKFMKYGQNHWKYVTKGADVLGGDKSAACGSFAAAFSSLLKSTDIDESSRVILIEQNFITGKLPATFIDPSCPGNVKIGAGNYADERKFFFSKHWIVQTKFGTYDPTNGTEAPASVWQKGFKETEKGIWKNSSYQLQLTDKNHMTGGGYVLTKL
ncbi:DUF4157 domain-containing protein [uncultured Tenacibaculum sp.]|uniref:eCIS core domain-containing protein n=1 Tax=uncultured Tenacibaculum sp. TaxID=174713 RepID=UPI002624B11A|nr:DUF4157 domain-containing protein [uncultured Tenacibaculum sp.]